jgi:hypothetical protein
MAASSCCKEIPTVRNLKGSALFALQNDSYVNGTKAALTLFLGASPANLMTKQEGAERWITTSAKPMETARSI